jgi:hypothetical protein
VSSCAKRMSNSARRGGIWLGPRADGRRRPRAIRRFRRDTAAEGRQKTRRRQRNVVESGMEGWSGAGLRPLAGGGESRRPKGVSNPDGVTPRGM